MQMQHFVSRKRIEGNYNEQAAIEEICDAPFRHVGYIRGPATLIPNPSASATHGMIHPIRLKPCVGGAAIPACRLRKVGLL